MTPRGYFGIGIFKGKSCDNIGGLWRSAHAFGASFIFTVGFRPPRQPTDTTKAAKHVPLFQFEDMAAFLAQQPTDSQLIGVETDDLATTTPLPRFPHPDRAVYLLGAEDRGLDDYALSVCDRIVSIPSSLCLNVATAGSIVLYDRVAKSSSLRLVALPEAKEAAA